MLTTTNILFSKLQLLGCTRKNVFEKKTGCKNQILLIAFLFCTTFSIAQTSHVVNHGVPLTVENGVTITFEGNFTNENAGTIDNNGAITLPGNWTNDAANGVFTGNTGTVSFLGTAAQSIGGTNPTDFSALTINNTSGTGVTLNQDATVSDVLTLTSGIVYTTAANILTMNAGSSNGAISYSSFVSGPMRKIGATDYNFPVGKDALTRPIAVENISASETFTAQYFHNSPDTANPQDPGAPYDVSSKDVSLHHVSTGEYWILTRAGAQSADVRLSWDSYSEGVDDLAGLAVARWDGAVWRDEGNGGTTGVVDPGRGTVISAAAVTSFVGPFTLASRSVDNPLPIELLTFTARANGKVVDVLWTTATEINSDYFTVERSQNATVFEEVGIVKAAGNSTTKLNYKKVDENPYMGISYYRLKQTDLDGKYAYSNIVPVEFKTNVGDGDFILFPNPNNGSVVSLLAKNLAASEKVLVSIRDVKGREVFLKEMYADEKGVFYTTIDNMYIFSDAVYIVTLTSTSNVFQRKLIIQ